MLRRRVIRKGRVRPGEGCSACVSPRKKIDAPSDSLAHLAARASMVARHRIRRA
jgi:hypothetical protein